MPTATITDLLDRLERGEPLLLPSAHAAAILRAEYDARQRMQGHRGWLPANVTTWIQWLTAQWNSLVARGDEERILLNSSQERALWQDIVQQLQPDNAPLASPGALAQMAQQAWNLAADYNALTRLRVSAHTSDNRTFAQWAETFQTRCRAQLYLPTALLPQAMLEHLERGTWTPPRQVQRVGHFDDVPATRLLLERMQELACSIETVLPQQAQPSGALQGSFVLPTPREELLYAAAWLRQQLSSLRNDSAAPSIALLVPSLAEERDEIEAVLREVFAPELPTLDEPSLQQPLWSSTRGPCLLLQPMVQDAIHVLQWTTRALHADSVTAVLLSPYFGQSANEAERARNARWDAGTLRNLLQLHDTFTLEHALRVASGEQHRSQHPAAQPSIFAHLHALHTASEPLQQAQRDRSYSEWMELARQLLRIMGWPGVRALSAEELTIVEAWESTLDTVATLDFQGRRVSFAQALEQLASHLQTSTTSTGQLAPILLMTPAESEGIFLDAAILLRATDTAWPLPDRANPLLAWSLQRSLQMPGTEPNAALQRTAAQVERLLRSCGQLRITRAAADVDGPLRASGVLQALHLPEQHIASPEDDIAVAPIPLEYAKEPTTLPALPAAQVQGGSSVLKLQSACGFRAYASLRLRARELGTFSTGLDASETGNLVHRVLQLLWGELRTRDALVSRAAAGTLEKLVRDCIAHAIPRQLNATSAWDDAYLSTLRHRIHLLVMDWLALEQRRPPFEVIEREEKQTLTLGPLELSVRMDRIDRVDDGFLLIDYKTGESGKVRDWEGDRPRDPQLPLYSLLYEPHELQGIAFAKVRSGERLSWNALLADAQLLPDRQTQADLEALQQEWRVHLTDLAEAFAAGHAAPDPRKFYEDCARCEYRQLCRIDSMDAAHATSTSDGTRGEEHTLDG